MFRNQGTACPQTFCRAHFLHEEQASEAPFGEYLLLAAASGSSSNIREIFLRDPHKQTHTHQQPRNKNTQNKVKQKYELSIQ